MMPSEEAMKPTGTKSKQAGAKGSVSRDKARKIGSQDARRFACCEKDWQEQNSFGRETRGYACAASCDEGRIEGSSDEVQRLTYRVPDRASTNRKDENKQHCKTKSRSLTAIRKKRGWVRDDSLNLLLPPALRLQDVAFTKEPAGRRRYERRLRSLPSSGQAG